MLGVVAMGEIFVVKSIVVDVLVYFSSIFVVFSLRGVQIEFGAWSFSEL